MRRGNSRLAIFVSILIISIAFSIPAFAVPDDSILSQHIGEADGTSGQDTNSGSGIKTGHIQDGAVTTGKIADGAVTDVKITGPISASKISSAGLDADTVDGMHASDLAPVVHTHSISDVLGLDAILGTKADINHNHDGVYAPIDHNHDGVYQKKYANVVVVAKSGGDFTDPISAVNSIINASAANPYLVKIMPGIYDVGAASLQMKQYVDIEGSGEANTVIASYVSSASLAPVLGASNSSIRELTVRHITSGDGNAIGIFTQASTHISNVTVEVSDTITAQGIHSYNTASTMKDVTISIKSPNSFGIYCIVGSCEISSSKVTIDSTGFANSNSCGITIYQASSTISDVEVSSFGGGGGVGVYFTTNGPEMQSTMTDTVVSISGTGGTQGVMTLSNHRVEIMRSTITAGSAPYSVGLSARGIKTTFDNSQVQGDTAVDAIGATFISNSKLEGSVTTNGGFIKCSNVIDGNYDPVFCN